MQIFNRVIEMFRAHGLVDWDAVILLSHMMALLGVQVSNGTLIPGRDRFETGTAAFFQALGMPKERVFSALSRVQEQVPALLVITGDTVTGTLDWEVLMDIWASTRVQHTGVEVALLPVSAIQHHSTRAISFPRERYIALLKKYAEFKGVALGRLPASIISKARASLKRLFRAGATDEEIIRGMEILQKLSKVKPYYRQWDMTLLENKWDSFLNGSLEQELRGAGEGRRKSVAETLKMLQETVYD